MEKNVKYLYTPNTLNVKLSGAGVYQLTVDDFRFDQVLELCRAGDYDALLSVLDAHSGILTFSEGNFHVRGRTLYYRNEPLDGFVISRTIDFIEQGLPYRPLLAFIERLQANPSRRAVQELYNFLEHKNLPITDDGHFLAYKAVCHDFLDKHTHTVLNLPGTVIEMQRNQVDDNAHNTCSYGFHAGSLQYVAGFGNGSTDKILIVKIDPADVVSIPRDCNGQKLRTCRYVVKELYLGELPDLYDASYAFTKSAVDGEDDDWDEEYDEEAWDVVEYYGGVIQEVEDERHW